jgi:hypothetical protein
VIEASALTTLTSGLSGTGRDLQAARFQLGGRGIELPRPLCGVPRCSRLRTCEDAINQLVFMLPPEPLTPDADQIGQGEPCPRASARKSKRYHSDPANDDRTDRAFEAATGNQ